MTSTLSGMAGITPKSLGLQKPLSFPISCPRHLLNAFPGGTFTDVHETAAPRPQSLAPPGSRRREGGHWGQWSAQSGSQSGGRAPLGCEALQGVIALSGKQRGRGCWPHRGESHVANSFPPRLLMAEKTSLPVSSTRNTKGAPSPGGRTTREKPGQDQASQHRGGPGAPR